jgi:hypothetical protein
MKYQQFESDGVTEREMPDEECNRLKEKRREALAKLDWKDAMLTYSDGLKRKTKYKVFDSNVYFMGSPSKDYYELHDLKIQARAWDDEKRIELNEKKELAKLTAERIIPEYNKKLIEKGYLSPDGITTTASLDDIAEFLFTQKLEKFNFKLLMQYRQIDGQSFSVNTAKEAIKRCKI